MGISISNFYYGHGDSRSWVTAHETAQTDVSPDGQCREHRNRRPLDARRHRRGLRADHDPAGGTDIWNTADEFHYYYAEASGDFDVAVRNTELERTDDWAKVGIMARESLAPDAANVMVRRNSDGEASLQWRPEDGAESDSNDLRMEGDWLRLEREDGTFRSYASTDGEELTPLTVLKPGDHGVDLSDELYLGLAVTSHDAGTLTTAEFRNLSGLSPTDNEDIGGVEVEGSVAVGTGVPSSRRGRQGA